MSGSTGKLSQGLQRLQQAGDDRDLLGSALLSIHGALEDHFRAWLAAQHRFPADQRALLANRQQVNWDKLIEWMQRYGGLSDDIARRIRQANRLRQEVAHGGSYSGTRSFLDGYAALVQTLCEDKYKLSARALQRAPTSPGRPRAAGSARPSQRAPRQAPPSGPSRPLKRKNTAKPGSAPRRRADAPPPWPVGFAGRFLVFLIVVLIIYVAITLAS
jgi:hypothetical protein